MSLYFLYSFTQDGFFSVSTKADPAEQGQNMTISSTIQYGEKEADEGGHEEARKITDTKIQGGVNNTVLLLQKREKSN